MQKFSTLLLAIFFGIFSNTIVCDAPRALQYSFQDPATPVMEGIIHLYDYLWHFLVFVVFFVTWMIVRIAILYRERDDQRVSIITQNVNLEIVWTLTPALILACVAGNSITHLYSAEEIMHSALDVTIIGSQWFWVYEFMVFKKKVILESHMIETEDLKLGSLRNLEVDNALVLPTETNVRLLVTSSDVIHSWAVPSLGVKVDAVPGRINECNVFIKRPGLYFGQCSEICGKGHAVMPICVYAVSKEDYNLYLHILNIKESAALEAVTKHVTNNLKINDFLREI